MLSNQILQDTIDGIKSISGVGLFVAGADGKIIVATDDGGERFESALPVFIASQAETRTTSDHLFFKIYDDSHLEFVLIVHASGDDGLMIGRMVAFQIRNLLTAYQERFDKDNFIKNLLLDNLLLADIYNRSKKLHIDVNAKRCVCIIETQNEQDNVALEALRTLFCEQRKDFITAVDEKSIILVKELTDRQGDQDIENLANTIVDMLNTEAMVTATVAYGTIVKEIREISRSYKEAKMALNVGKIFSDGRKVISYDNLGIGRLIFQLPVPLCKMFIEEVFEGISPDQFRGEQIATINSFFENNLNVSETARKLYIHRNTLVYRLDKLKKLTGMDIRIFEDAITFKIAMMVAKYLEYINNNG